MKESLEYFLAFFQLPLWAIFPALAIGLITYAQALFFNFILREAGGLESKKSFIKGFLGITILLFFLEGIASIYHGWQLHDWILAPACLISTWTIILIRNKAALKDFILKAKLS